MERNYTEEMRFFDHDAYVKLAEKMKASSEPEAAEDLGALNDAMTSFREYVNRVDAGEQQIRLTSVVLYRNHTHNISSFFVKRGQPDCPEKI